jgi:hypothetical protein
MLGQTPDFGSWHAWVNEAALAAFAVFACFVVYKVVMHGGKKAMELGERYVTSTESLHETLRASEDNRSRLCERHAAGLEDVTEAVSVGNQHLSQLVQLHQAPGGSVHDAIGVIHKDHVDIQRGKRVMLHACRMCREVARREFPNSAAEVDKHCAEIEREIGEA